MSTMLRIGPHDHGRELTYEEFLTGDYQEGYKYELIRGELYVSPQASFPHDWVEGHVRKVLTFYWAKRPDLVKWVSPKARVFIPGEGETCPEPDIAVYRDCQPGKTADWRQFSPLIVVEVVSETDPDKDYVRNVELYRKVPSILEYWLFDRCSEDDGPTLRVHRRDSGDQSWKIDDYDSGATYTTPLLPDFSLPVSPDEE
jgi:Uma2 family endonuclease